MKLLKNKQFTAKQQRIFFIVTGVSLILIVVGVYGIYSATTWNSYKASYEAWQTEIRTEINSAMKQPASTQAERSKKKAAFTAISARISDARQSLCEMASIVSWQRFIGELREREEACDHIVERASAFDDTLDDVTTYLSHEQKLASILATAIKDSATKTTEATWESQVAIWNTASKAINGIDTAGKFEPVKVGAGDKVQAIKSAWSELIAAHTAKDKTNYVEAQAKLTTAYEALPSVVNLSSQHLIPLADSLEIAYKKFTANPKA